MIERTLPEIRRRRTRLIAILAGYLPCIITVDLGLKALGVDGDPFLPYLFVLFMVLFAVAGWRAAATRCPRCAELFCMTRSVMGIQVGNVWTSRCVHCGLSVHDDRQ